MPLPKREDWKAPWEKKGEDVDPAKAADFLYSLLAREEKAQADLAAAETARQAAEQASAALQTKLDEQTAAGGPQIEALQRQVTELNTQLDEAKNSSAAEAQKSKLRYEVGLELGLTPRQLAKLDGDTKEALLEDAQETFGVSGKNEDEESNRPPRTRPQSKMRNPGDPDPDEVPFDRAKALEQIPRT